MLQKYPMKNCFFQNILNQTLIRFTLHVTQEKSLPNDPRRSYDKIDLVSNLIMLRLPRYALRSSYFSNYPRKVWCNFKSLIKPKISILILSLQTWLLTHKKKKKIIDCEFRKEHLYYTLYAKKCINI